jgi:anti-anti-sigma factor
MVVVRGEIDLKTEGAFREALDTPLPEPGTGLLICDLSQVTFLSAGALTVLVETKQRLASRGASLGVIATRRNVVRVFELTGLVEHLNVGADLASLVWGEAHPRCNR